MCLRKDVSLPLTGDNMNTIKKSLKDRVWDYLIKMKIYRSGNLDDRWKQLLSSEKQKTVELHAISEFALYLDVMNRYFLHSYYVPDEVSFRKSL